MSRVHESELCKHSVRSSAKTAKIPEKLLQMKRVDDGAAHAGQHVFSGRSESKKRNSQYASRLNSVSAEREEPEDKCGERKVGNPLDFFRWQVGRV